MSKDIRINKENSTSNTNQINHFQIAENQDLFLYKIKPINRYLTFFEIHHS